jgi:hypothetical protein
MRRLYFALLIAIALSPMIQVGIGQGSDVAPFRPYDPSPVLPDFTRDALRYQASGHITCQLRFHNGQAIEAKVIFSDISTTAITSWRTDPSADLMTKTASTLLRWQSLESKDFSETVNITYKFDSGLSQNERQFRLEYGAHSVPIRVEITGPTMAIK